MILITLQKKASHDILQIVIFYLQGAYILMKAIFRYYLRGFIVVLLFSLSLGACGESTTSSTNQNSGPTTIHLAYFPNLTHAVALVGVARGTFQKAIGSNHLDTKIFNAGPDLINALLAGSIDIGFVGPNPAINGYITSHGGLQIISGASSGGALLIVRSEANIKTAKDLNGKKLADPQNGGTQDISLRHYLQVNGLKTTDQGGTIQIIPTDNPTILTEFKQGQIDGAWVPEPWASRLVVESQGAQNHGQIFVDERTLWPDHKFVTTNVVVRKSFLDQHPDIVKQFLQADVETVQYIQSNPDDAKKLINSQLQTLTGKPLSSVVLDQALKNLDFTYDPLASTLFQAADNAYALKLLKSKPDKGIYNLNPLNTILASKGLAKVSAL
jgi:NitT/TauT family transport system substrate-binding protein